MSDAHSQDRDDSPVEDQIVVLHEAITSSKVLPGIDLTELTRHLASPTPTAIRAFRSAIQRRL